MKKIVIKAITLLLAVSFLLPALVSCKEEKIYSDVKYEYFDTVSVIYDYSNPKSEDFSELCDTLWSRLREYHRLYDIYHEYSGLTNLAVLNAKAGEGCVEVDERIIDLIEYSKELYRKTGGEVNIAMGAVLKLWHNARIDGGGIPNPDELSAAMAHTNIDDVIIDRENMTVELRDPEMSLDVGAIAKGYASEMLALYAESLGCTSLVIDLGGNIRTVGDLYGGGWEVKIQNPDLYSDTATVYTVNGLSGAIATSGNYQRFFTYEGKKYHHIIDKDTLMPAEYFASVSVVSDNAALSDALSTALFCMPKAEGESLALSVVGVRDVIWIYDNGKIETLK